MPLLSLCVIARDEAELLPRMLDSVKGVVDEIIVVDTGSGDRTAEIARRHGARVIRKPFQDDFSAARNLSLNAARGRWILVLDCDEYLAQGTGTVIRRAIRRRDHAGFHLHFINHLGEGRRHVCAITRLFLNHPDIRYRYIIHEQVLQDLIPFARRRGLALEVLSDAVVHHDGYLPERSRARGKDQRNEHLFRLQVEKYPDHAYSWYKFGDFLRRFEGRKDEALTALNRAATCVRAMTHEEANELSFPAEIFALLAVDTDKAGDPKAAQAIAVEGRERCGETPNLLYVLGHLLARFGRHREAFETYARLRTFANRLLAVPPEPGVTGPIAFFGMGRALACLGHPRAAFNCLKRSVLLAPDNREPRLLLARLHLERNEIPQAILQDEAILEFAPQDASVRLRLGTLLLHSDDIQAALATLRAALHCGAPEQVILPTLGQALLASGELEEAYTTFARVAQQPDAHTGMRLLELLATGGDPRALPELSSGAAGRWLHYLELAGLAKLPATVSQGEM